VARQRSLVDVVEAAYDVVPDDARWLAGLLEASRPELDRGFGVGGILFEGSEPATFRVRASSDVGMPPDLHSAALACIGTTAPHEIQKFFYGEPVSTVSEVAGPELMQRDVPRERLTVAYGIHDIIGMTAADPTGAGCCIVACVPRLTKLPSSFTRTWSRIASHIAAGFRLRRAPAASGTDLGAGAEAVLSPTGKTVHAEEPASSKTARETLKDAAVAMDRARRLAKRDPEEAISIWQGLVAGRWSLVDRFDNDGRRFLVVKRNDPEPAGPTPRALTLQERQVVGYAALGHSNKLIAYELGLSPSIIATRLKAAAKKLGCRSRVELVSVMARAAAGG
jgi:DNA-binding CsgD family transcriptional regulator